MERAPEFKRLPESEVTVWGTLSLLVQVTLVPVFTVIVEGLNEKLLMFIAATFAGGVAAGALGAGAAGAGAAGAGELATGLTALGAV